MKVEGSHRSSLMLLRNSFAADFAVHFFLGSIYQYREERNTGKIGKERGHLFEQRNGHTTGGYKLRSVLASSARCSACGTFRLRGYATPKRLVAANRYAQFFGVNSEKCSYNSTCSSFLLPDVSMVFCRRQ